MTEETKLESYHMQKSVTGPMFLAIAMTNDESATSGSSMSMDGQKQDTCGGFSDSIKQQSLQNIIEDDKSWAEIKRRLQEAQTVSSVHVKDACGSLVHRKAEKIKTERKPNLLSVSFGISSIRSKFVMA